MKVLVVGEAIIDENYACKTLGRSMKAPIIAAQYESHERYRGRFAGGRQSRRRVLRSRRPGRDGREQKTRTKNGFARSSRQNVSPTFWRKTDAPTIVKRRYRESYFGTPLFEINYLNDKALSIADDDKAVRCAGSDNREAYDAVIVADYGHSMLSENARRVICDGAKFVAVNPQVNSANVGYQTISKYPRADFVVSGAAGTRARVPRTATAACAK